MDLTDAFQRTSDEALRSFGNGNQRRERKHPDSRDGLSKLNLSAHSIHEDCTGIDGLKEVGFARTICSGQDDEVSNLV